jgi:hypothetical protein
MARIAAAALWSNAGHPLANSLVSEFGGILQTIQRMVMPVALPVDTSVRIIPFSGGLPHKMFATPLVDFDFVDRWTGSRFVRGLVAERLRAKPQSMLVERRSKWRAKRVTWREWSASQQQQAPAGRTRSKRKLEQ